MEDNSKTATYLYNMLIDSAGTSSFHEKHKKLHEYLSSLTDKERPNIIEEAFKTYDSYRSGRER